MRHDTCPFWRVPFNESDIVHTYFLAKARVVACGYGEELRWQKHRTKQELCEQEVLAEAAWVILNGGMRERVIRQLFPRISNAFFNWTSAAMICAKLNS